MQILEYDQVDPIQVLHLNLLSLDYALTPERVALMRALGRIFPFFAATPSKMVSPVRWSFTGYR
jgi:hypothetical protein